MKVARLNGELADPAAPAWGGAEAVSITLGPVPIGAQPTAYIREAWAGRSYGTTGAATLAAASDGERLYLRLEWPDGATPNGEFQDAVAAMFPAGGDAPVATMGDHDRPVELWFWENGRGPLRLTSRGPGVVRKEAADGVAARGDLAGGRWSVVLSGPKPAAGKPVGVAVWDGSNDERAGLAAVSQEWLQLELA
ncbi:MAG: hypothetical protein IT303_18100 [Dehalococcoidia bacterium]|nr:hypothetical protein [Dehalococcoidia bacterium]